MTQLHGLIGGRNWNERREVKERQKKNPVSFWQPAAFSAPEESKAGADGDKTEKKGDLEIRRRAFEIDCEGNRMRGENKTAGPRLFLIR